MKTYRYFATTAACIIMSLGAHAQKNIDNAIDDFVNNKNYEEYIKKRSYNGAKRRKRQILLLFIYL